MTCDGGEDVGENTRYGWQRTRTVDYVSDSPLPHPSEPESEPESVDHNDLSEDVEEYDDDVEEYDDDDDVDKDEQSGAFSNSFDVPRTSRCARGHYRIFIKEIGRSLADFANWQELIILLIHALCGKP